MKNLKFLVVALVAMFGFTACNKDCGHNFIEYDYSEYDEDVDNWFAIPSVDDELYDNWKKYKIADLETEPAYESVYYPDIRNSDTWDEYDLDQYDSGNDSNDNTDTWDDDWDDDDMDWDSDYDWDDSGSDWDSEW